VTRRRPHQAIIEADGSLAIYDNAFADVTPAQAEQAAILENEIRATKGGVEEHFYHLALLLDRFEREKHYLARGYERMKDWCESPEIELSWRVVHDLLRIIRELIPALETQGLSTEEAHRLVREVGISKARAILPLIRVAEARPQLPALVEQAVSLRWRDVVAEVKERIETHPKAEAIRFTAYVVDRPSQARLDIVGTDGMRIERLGTLVIPHEWLPKFISRFSRFVEFCSVTESE